MNTSAEPAVRNHESPSLVTSCVDMSLDGHEACRLQMQALVGEIDDLRDEKRRLQDHVAQLKRMIFGRRSEKISLEELGQLVIVPLQSDDDPAAASEPASGDETKPDDVQPIKRPKKRRPNHKGRTAIDPKLERVIGEVIPLPPERCHCDTCGLDLFIREIPVKEEVEHIPERLVVRVTLCQQGFCRACKGDAVNSTLGQGIGAPLSRAGSSLMANLIESKCDDSLPINRQCQRLARLGYTVPLNTLYGYWDESLDLLRPIAEAVARECLASDVVAADDTRLIVIDSAKKRKPDDKTAKSEKMRLKGHLWCFEARDGNCAFVFTEGWKASEIGEVFRKIPEFIQCDDYKGYSSKAIEEDGIFRELVREEFRLGCGMHIRRKFEFAFKIGDTRAKIPLRLFAALYEIEADAKNRLLNVEERHALRQEKSIPILDELETWLDECKLKVGKTSAMAKAVRYAINQRVYFRRCFSDGRFEIDNGRCERSLRKPALGRKNYLFAGSLKGAERLATAYTLVMSCRGLGINTRDYLIDVLNQLRSGFPATRAAELTPRSWALSRELIAA